MSKMVIGLTGLAGAGKSTAAQFLVDAHDFTRMPFAAPLKRMALDLGFTEDEIGPGKEQLFDWGSLPPSLALPRAMRAMGRIVPLGWTHPDVSGLPRSTLGGKSVDETVNALRLWYETDRAAWKAPRIFLQRLGTEWGRQRIHSEIWVEAWKTALQTEEWGEDHPLPFVADDCRFENEARVIRAMGGKVVRIERSGSGSATGSAHASEKGVAPDITIQNDGPPEVLRARILGVLDRYFAAEAI